MDDAARFLPCPHCAAMNRVPQARLADMPVCGRCRERLFPAAPFALTAANFDIHALRSGVPLLVDFWAPWCGPCLQMAPAFAAAGRALEPDLRLGKVDTEAEPALGARFAIRSIPTLVLFAGGREVARHSGAIGTAQVVQWARAHMSAH